jgi:DNA repair exonuclease SbcCD ATPase subunit
MVTFLKGLRRPDNEAATAVATSRAERSAATREHAALEALVARAEAAAERLGALSAITETAEALEAMQKRFAAVESQLAGLEQLGARFASVEEQAERVTKAQSRTETQLTHAAENVDRIQGQMGAVSDKLDRALLLRDELGKFLDLEGPMSALRTEADTLRTQLADLADGVTRMRAQHDDALRAHRHTTSRLEAFDQDHQAAAGKLDEVARRVQTVERSLEPITQATEAIPNVQHQLAVLKALADQVAQKAATLEQQREAVDRAANQISQLTRLDRELDVWLRRQEEQIRRFSTVEAKVAEVQAVQGKVLARNDELQAGQQQLDEGQRTARQALTDLREQMRKSSEGFELENRGLHAVSERIGDLRTAVKECEGRFAVLDAASQGATAVQAQVRTLADQSTELSQELARLSEEARRIGSMRQDAERLEALATEVATRMQRIEEVKPQVDEVVQQLGTLNGTHELMADGLEQMRLAYDEMSRLRDTHAETQAWLANADIWTRKVQTQVKELSGMEPAVERIRSDVEQVKVAMTDIEGRRALVDEVHGRLTELATLSADLKARTDSLRTRMDGAEGRFTQLSRQAEEAQRVADVMGEVTGSVGRAEQRIGAIDDSVRVLEARTQQLDELEERIRLLGQEIEQRQGALDRATEHLARASTVRQEAAAAAQQLEEVSRGIGSALTDAEARSGHLEKVAGNLESRATALKAIDRQLTHFEELLGKWDSAQAEAARALEQTLARQGAVEALEAQVKHVFELAERAVDDVQTLGAARREVEETRELLQDTQTQFKAAETALAGFEARRRQLERAEQRLARAEALAVDVRSAVEALQAQRTVVDHVIERAGALTFQMKQAEALVEVLRRERTLAGDLKAAIASVQEEDEETL